MPLPIGRRRALFAGDPARARPMCGEMKRCDCAQSLARPTRTLGNLVRTAAARRLLITRASPGKGLHKAQGQAGRVPGNLERKTIMSNASKRGEGAAEELGGKIKGAIGKVIGNEQMQAEGKAKELEGKAKQEAAKAGERVKGAVEEAVGAAKNRVGALIDNEQMEVEGKAKELKGEARQEANKR
jgi:uncharacterized protein YjbJ (UPF0337 family)